MAGSKISNYSPSTVNLTSVMNTLDNTRPGFMQFDWSTDVNPNIDAYGLIECAGSLFQFSTIEPTSTAGVTLSTTDQINYVRLVPTSSKCTAELSTAVPVWRKDYHGWYDSTSGVKRYIGAMVANSTDYWKNINILSEKNIGYCYITGSSQLASSAFLFATKKVDILNEYSTSNYTYTPKNTGSYEFLLNISVTNVSIYTGAEIWNITSTLLVNRFLQSLPASTSISALYSGKTNVQLSSGNSYSIKWVYGSSNNYISTTAFIENQIIIRHI